MTQLNSLSIKGENLSGWLVYILAILGITGCIFTAQLVVPENLQSKVFAPWITKLNQELDKNPVKLSNLNIKVKTETAQPEIISNKHEAVIKVENKLPIKLETYDCPVLLTFTFEKNIIEPQKPENPLIIKQLKEWLETHPKATILLKGYSSSKGRQESNLILSYRRSKAVKKFLVNNGIMDKQILTHAFGEEVPLAGEPTTSKKNQRVSMQINGINEC